MSRRPLACCDMDCATANGCRVGGYQCEECGEWYCPIISGNNGLCDYCAKENNNKKGDNE